MSVTPASKKAETGRSLGPVEYEPSEDMSLRFRKRPYLRRIDGM